MFNFIKEVFKKESSLFYGGSVCSWVFYVIKIPSGAFNNETFVKYATTFILAVLTGLGTAMGAYLWKYGKAWAVKTYSRIFKKKVNDKGQEKTNGNSAAA